MTKKISHNRGAQFWQIFKQSWNMIPKADQTIQRYIELFCRVAGLK